MTFPPLTLGVVIALVVLLLVILLSVLGRIPVLEAGLFGGLAIARLT